MSDSFSRTIFHRSVTQNDTPLFTLAERTRLLTLKQKDDRENGLITTAGARNMEFGFYGIGIDGGTAVATLLGIPPIVDRLPMSQAPFGPRPIRLGEFLVTFGTSTETDLEPIIGVTVAGTWRAAKAIVTTAEGTGIKLWDVAAAAGIARAVIDPLQCPRIFMYISALTNMTRVDVCSRRISRFDSFA